MLGLRLIIPVANVQVLRLAARRGQGIIGRRDSGEKINNLYFRLGF